MKRLAVLLLLALACAALFRLRPPAVETSLFALVGDGGLRMPAAVLNRGSGEIQVLFRAADRDTAEAAARRFHDGLSREDFGAVRFRTDGEVFGSVLDFYATAGGGFVSGPDRALLEAGNTAALRDRALRHWFGVTLPLYGPERDPFALLQGFITSRPLAVSGWQDAGGVLAQERDGATWLLMTLSLKLEIVSDIDALVSATERLKALRESCLSGGTEIFLSGVPLHTAEVAGRCKREIAWLSAFSLLVIVVTAWLALRSARRFPRLLYVPAVGGLAGLLALLIFCPTVHLLAGVFATTLLGMTVDYAFHGMLATPGSGRPVRRNLFFSWLTTELALLPLLFSGLPVLAQAAVFMAAGLTGSFLAALAETGGQAPADAAASEARPVRAAWLRFVPTALFLALLPFAFTLEFGTRVRDFHTPSSELLDAEETFRRLTFPDRGETTGGLLTVTADDLETLLERIAALPLPEGTPTLTRFVPPYAERVRVAALEATLAEREGATLAEAIGLERLPVAPAARRLTVADLPPVLRDGFLTEAEAGGLLTVIPDAPEPDGMPEGVAWYVPQAALDAMLDGLAATVRKLLLAVGAVLLTVLIVRYGLRAWKIALPSLLAVLSVFVAVGMLGGTVNLFHLLACFMLIGMTLDYTVFFASDARHSLKPVTCSFVTSLAGFGALTAVSFLVVRSIGQVFAVGLTVAYVSGWLLFRSSRAASAPASVGTEVGASALGLRAAELLYRVLGRWALDALAWTVAHVVWFTSAKVRRAVGSRRRMVSFALTMTDRFAVMSRGRGQPAVEAAEDADTRAFLKDVTARRGVFILASHFGAIEALPALNDRDDITLHAFMRIQQTAVFNAFYLSRIRRKNVRIRPVSDFGMGELFEADDCLDAGDCVLMAGDRAFGRTEEVTFLGRKVGFPKGVFRFAALTEHPVWFVVCYRVAKRRYRVEAHPMAADATLPQRFASALEPYVRAWPDQWYNWELLA